MKCNRCHSNIPDLSQVCPFCGKRFSQAATQKPAQERLENVDEFEGVSLSMPGISSNPAPAARPSVLDMENPPEDEFVDENEEYENFFEIDSEDPPASDEVIETYDSMDDFEPHELQLAGAEGEESGEGGMPDLMFMPPKEPETGIRRIAETLPDRDIITEDPFHSTGNIGPKVEKKNWDAYPDRIEPGRHFATSGQASTDQVRELSMEIIPRKPPNAVAGFMAIVMALFMMMKSGVWLLDWFHFFNKELYQLWIAPWIERVELGVVVLVVWVIAAVARPVSLKILALLFSFAATVLYGLMIYLRYFAAS